MNRLLLVISALVISSLSFAKDSATVSDVSGTYVLKLSEESAALCRLLQTPMPQAKVTLKRDSRYRFEGNFEGKPLATEGNFAVRNNSLVMYSNSGQAVIHKGVVQRDVLLLDGLVYERLSGSAIAGTWHVIGGNGQADRSIRFNFTEEGTFQFSGMGGTSKGRYEVNGNVVHLDYTEVDGQRVDFPMKGKATLSTNSSALRIDNFRYVRA